MNWGLLSIVKMKATRTEVLVEIAPGMEIIRCGNYRQCGGEQDLCLYCDDYDSVEDKCVRYDRVKLRRLRPGQKLDLVPPITEETRRRFLIEMLGGEADLRKLIHEVEALDERMEGQE